MFTGIVENVGLVRSMSAGEHGARLRIDAGPAAEGVTPGASVAVNGVCLTAVELAGTCLSFDVIAETLRRTNLGQLTEGRRVNLERSLRASDRMDGHFVQGHVDGRAAVVRIDRDGGEWLVALKPDSGIRRYFIPKGSVALDGVSLTIASVEPEQFSVALIPTTLQRTTLADWHVGDQVNVETDIIARTVVHILERQTRDSNAGQNSRRERP